MLAYSRSRHADATPARARRDLPTTPATHTKARSEPRQNVHTIYSQESDRVPITKHVMLIHFSAGPHLLAQLHHDVRRSRRPLPEVLLPPRPLVQTRSQLSGEVGGYTQKHCMRDTGYLADDMHRAMMLGAHILKSHRLRPARLASAASATCCPHRASPHRRHHPSDSPAACAWPLLLVQAPGPGSARQCL